MIAGVDRAADRVNLDDLRRLRDEALAAGTGSGKWIKCAQTLMDVLPSLYAMAKAMNERHERLAGMAHALKDACDLLEGWVVTKCPSRYRAEHMSHIQGLRSTLPAKPVDGAPTVVGVLVVWRCVREGLPTEGRTVQLYMPSLVNEAIGETGVCEGYREPGSSIFMSTEGDPLPGVEWWADQTARPIAPVT